MADPAGADIDPAVLARFENFYEHYCPDQLPFAAVVLTSYKGREEALMAKLVKKWGPEPPPKPEADDDPPPGPEAESTSDPPPEPAAERDTPAAAPEDSNDPGEIADALLKAMKGFGTDEDGIYKQLGRIDSQPLWDAVKDAFRERHPKFHKGDVVAALKDELSKKEYEKAEKVLGDNGVQMTVPEPATAETDSKDPGEIADALLKAMKGIGTDEDGIYKQLGRIDSQPLWDAVKDAFRERHPKFHKGDVVAALKDELSKKEYEKAEKVLGDNGVQMADSAAAPEDSKDPGDIADALLKAMKGFGTDEDGIYKQLGRIDSQPLWDAVKDAFKEKHAKFHKGDVVAALKDELTKKEYEKAEKVLGDNGVQMEVRGGPPSDDVPPPPADDEVPPAEPTSPLDDPPPGSVPHTPAAAASIPTSAPASIAAAHAADDDLPPAPATPVGAGLADPDSHPVPPATTPAHGALSDAPPSDATAPAGIVGDDADAEAAEEEEEEVLNMTSRVVEPQPSGGGDALTRAASSYNRRLIATPGGWVLEELKTKAPSVVKTPKETPVSTAGAAPLRTVDLPDLDRVDMVSVASVSSQPAPTPQPKRSASPRTRVKSFRRAGSKRKSQPKVGVLVDKFEGGADDAVASPSWAAQSRTMPHGMSPPSHEALRQARLRLADKEAELKRRQQRRDAVAAPGTPENQYRLELIRTYKRLRRQALSAQASIMEKDKLIDDLQRRPGRDVGGKGGQSTLVMDAHKAILRQRERMMAKHNEIQYLEDQCAHVNDALVASAETVFQSDVKLYHAKKTLRRIAAASQERASPRPASESRGRDAVYNSRDPRNPASPQHPEGAASPARPAATVQTLQHYDASPAANDVHTLFAQARQQERRANRAIQTPSSPDPMAAVQQQEQPQHEDALDGIDSVEALIKHAYGMGRDSVPAPQSSTVAPVAHNSEAPANVESLLATAFDMGRQELDMQPDGGPVSRQSIASAGYPAPVDKRNTAIEGGCEEVRLSALLASYSAQPSIANTQAEESFPFGAGGQSSAPPPAGKHNTAIEAPGGEVELADLLASVSRRDSPADLESAVAAAYDIGRRESEGAAVRAQPSTHNVTRAQLEAMVAAAYQRGRRGDRIAPHLDALMWQVGEEGAPQPQPQPQPRGHLSIPLEQKHPSGMSMASTARPPTDPNACEMDGFMVMLLDELKRNY